MSRKRNSILKSPLVFMFGVLVWTLFVPVDRAFSQLNPDSLESIQGFIAESIHPLSSRSVFTTGGEAIDVVGDEINRRSKFLYQVYKEGHKNPENALMILEQLKSKLIEERLQYGVDVSKQKIRKLSFVRADFFGDLRHDRHYQLFYAIRSYQQQLLAMKEKKPLLDTHDSFKGPRTESISTIRSFPSIKKDSLNESPVQSNKFITRRLDLTDALVSPGVFVVPFAELSDLSFSIGNAMDFGLDEKIYNISHITFEISFKDRSLDSKKDYISEGGTEYKDRKWTSLPVTAVNLTDNEMFLKSSLVFLVNTDCTQQSDRSWSCSLFVAHKKQEGLRNFKMNIMAIFDCINYGSDHELGFPYFQLDIDLEKKTFEVSR
jgi:hypothetical protein